MVPGAGVAKLSSVVSEIVFATSASHRSKASELAAETPSVDIESIRDHALYLHLLPVTVNRIQSAAIANTRNAAHPSAVTASEVRTIAYTHRLARLLPVVSSSIDYETAIAHVCLSLVKRHLFLNDSRSRLRSRSSIHGDLGRKLTRSRSSTLGACQP
jgi:hypothetical protein